MKTQQKQTDLHTKQDMSLPLLSDALLHARQKSNGFVPQKQTQQQQKKNLLPFAQKRLGLDPIQQEALTIANSPQAGDSKLTPEQRTKRNANRLKLILADLLRKDAENVPLSPKEEELLAELYRRRYLNHRETTHVDADGNVRVHKVNDAEPIMDAMKAYGDFIDRHASVRRAQRIVGSIDPLTALNWAQEWNLKIGTKEFAMKAVKRLRGDIDYRRFRVGG